MEIWNIFLLIWQCTCHILTAVWYLVHKKELCNPSRRFINHNCKGLVIVTFCWLTGWHQGGCAWELGDFRARNMHESPFVFNPLCRTVPCTKGMYEYCIGCLLILQLDCQVYTCGQWQNLRIAERSDVLNALYCFERGKYVQCSECQQFWNFMLDH
jgi:hypothetical protein